MKKILLKVFLFMSGTMGLVGGLSQLLVLLFGQIFPDSPEMSYYASLLSGFAGLILFFLLIYFFLVRRLKRVTVAVKEVSEGNFSARAQVNGNDEISELAANFNAMAEGLAANEYLSREFVKNVSHEFKTPVSVIMGYCELMRDPVCTREECAEYAAVVHNEAKRLNGLSAELLAISRLDSGGTVRCEDVFRADEQLRTILLAFQPQWEKRGLNVEAEMEPLNIVSNADLCQLIWRNLISNAVKYCTEGGMVRVNLRRSGDKMIFEIVNTGAAECGEEGMFRPFYTTSADGTGLGLPLVRKIADKLCGTISVNCAENTSFTVTLPVGFYEQ